MKRTKTSFVEALKQIKEIVDTHSTIKIREIFDVLAGKGYAALLILLSFPFCLPIQIPGFSTPFGLILAFLGLRIAFAKNLWWPEWVLDKELSSSSINKLVTNMLKVFQNRKFRIFRLGRLNFFTQNAFFHRLNGILVFFLSLFLSLPLPIPMTNLLAAAPILFIGLGLLKDDGLFIIIAYILAALCISVFTFLFLWGRAHLVAMTS